MSKTVFVGLSGGVDSAVSAALLKEKGFNVVGVFIKIWQPEFIECTWARDRLDAMRVAVALDIPFREIDLSSDYGRMVVEEMIASYASGITPNPDVLCNRHIKFGSFMKYALREGADYIATGHYARVASGDRRLSQNGRRFTQKQSKTEFELLRGRDKNKDQSYFLYTLGQRDLARTIFPVGGLLKRHVRTLAQKWQLPVAQKSDSQGLCFVGDVSMKDFLSRYLKLESGPVLDSAGTVIGSHDGAALYTIGQRHGFTVERGAGDGKPHYVVSVDISANTIRVSPRREDAARNEAPVDSMRWIGKAPELPFKATTQARYREEPCSATITKAGTEIKIIFDEPQIAARGQSLVVYDGTRCLGGGVIAH
ncbi:MAG: tRNA 2-thiouridine(34) synthase MnmA [bacterium]|nr:tRNA 2-thiouridine(34) synthase MnmA [bacterium]